jgi:hypothetical protein
MHVVTDRDEVALDGSLTSGGIDIAHGVKNARIPRRAARTAAAS